MRLKHAHALLDRCFSGAAEGAARLAESQEPRFAERMSAVWLEYRWYVEGAGLAEVFLKWKRGKVEDAHEAEAAVLRVHLLGASPKLAARAQALLEGGTPSPEGILDLFGEDGVHRDCVTFGETRVTVEHWAGTGPRPLHEADTFAALADVLASPRASPEERHEAIHRLTQERSARVVSVLLGHLTLRPSLMALRVLSEWGVQEARTSLQAALQEAALDNPADLWALTALQRRLEAWTAVSSGP